MPPPIRIDYQSSIETEIQATDSNHLCRWQNQLISEIITIHSPNCVRLGTKIKFLLESGKNSRPMIAVLILFVHTVKYIHSTSKVLSINRYQTLTTLEG